MRFLSKRVIAFGHDVVAAGVAVLLAYLLRYSSFSILQQPLVWGYALIACCVMGVSVLLAKTYMRSWRYVSLDDMRVFIWPVLITTIGSVLLLFGFSRMEGVPRSLPLLQAVLTFCLMVGTRLVYRVFRERRVRLDLHRHRPVPVLLFGLNDTSELFLRDSAKLSSSPFRVVGMVDQQADMHGRLVRNVRVMGALDEVDKVYGKLRRKERLPQKWLLAPDYWRGEQTAYILELAGEYGVSIERLPRMTDFLQALQEEQLTLKPIAIEDLLSRPQRHLDSNQTKARTHQSTVLITGAGGSIGSELVRQLARFSPKMLVLYELSEQNLYHIDKELEESFPHIPRRAIIGDVRDPKQLGETFALLKPDIVYHAAALKHVPLSEANSAQAFMTNVLGSKYVAEACLANHVKQMVMISTDKAVNPTNVMGASKRLAEQWLQSFGQANPALRCTTIRFGNVLGSSGSVVPLFRRQIQAGGPVTVTDKEITRYFMTIREAVSLVLHTGTIDAALQDEPHIYVLDMGAPVSIVDLAEKMIRLSGFMPYEDIDITFTGLRPGEKLYEELFYQGEDPQPSKADAILIAKATILPLKQMDAHIAHLASYSQINVAQLLQQKPSKPSLTVAV